jgi:hypothetical protein
VLSTDKDQAAGPEWIVEGKAPVTLLNEFCAKVRRGYYSVIPV